MSRYLVFVWSLLLLSTSAFAERESRTIPLQKIFTPTGFDNNDNVEVVVYGHLPNLCYHTPTASAEINGNSVTVTAKANYVEQTYCPEVTVPFSLTVTLGQLEADRYDVSLRDVDQTQATELVVTEAPAESTDNFYYANVEKVYVSKNNKTVRLAVRGLSSCLKYDRIGTMDNGVDVISLLPILEYNLELCEPEDKEQILTWDVPEEWQSKTALLHVRSMNGLSRNVILNSKAPIPLQ